MSAPALLIIGRLLILGAATVQPTSANGPAVVVPQSATPTAVYSTATKSAVRDYASIVYSAPGQAQSINVSDNADTQLTGEEAALFAATNQEREAQGLNDLQIDPLLCAIARGHSQDMAERNYFDHLAPAPGPVTPMDRYLAALGNPPSYAFLGENIYFRSATDSAEVSATEANNAFMRSTGHRANILQPRFTKIGIGFYRDPSTGAFWVTEMFLRDQN